jgi:ribosomal protein S1
MTAWEDLKSSLSVGQIVSGKVVSHAPFGVFVDLGLPFLGVVEIPYFKDDTARLQREDFPAVGATIRARIIAFADHNHQVRLSVRPGDLAEPPG